MYDATRSGLDFAITQPLQGDFMRKITDTQGKFLKDFDLLVSNPPYIPTKEEVQKGILETIGSPNFFAGISLPHYLMTQGLDRLPKGGNLLLLLTSCSLMSRYESYNQNDLASLCRSNKKRSCPLQSVSEPPFQHRGV